MKAGILAMVNAVQQPCKIRDTKRSCQTHIADEPSFYVRTCPPCVFAMGDAARASSPRIDNLTHRRVVYPHHLGNGCQRIPVRFMGLLDQLMPYRLRLLLDIREEIL